MKNIKAINIMGKIIAIGGGEIGELETLPIDRRIVKLVNKNKPRVLYIPTAGGDSEFWCDTFKKVYGYKLKCQVDFLLLIKEDLTKKEIANKILSADIIYVGGGDTLKMLKVWRKQGVDKILHQAYKKSVIMTGISAGAICWFHYGVSDAVINPRDKKLFGRVKGLNIISSKQSMTLSPHNIREKKIREESIKEIMSHTSGVCLAIDDNAALFIQDDKQIKEYKIWTSKKDVGIKKIFKLKNKIIIKQLKKKGNLVELSEK
jgi:dipeptidase E